MAKFTTAPAQSFEPEEAAAPEPTAADALTSFVESDMLYIILVAVIVIFLGFQFGRWAMNRDSGEQDDDGEADLRRR